MHVTSQSEIMKYFLLLFIPLSVSAELQIIDVDSLDQREQRSSNDFYIQQQKLDRFVEEQRQNAWLERQQMLRMEQQQQQMNYWLEDGNSQ